MSYWSPQENDYGLDTEYNTNAYNANLLAGRPNFVDWEEDYTLTAYSAPTPGIQLPSLASRFPPSRASSSSAAAFQPQFEGDEYDEDFADWGAGSGPVRAIPSATSGGCPFGNAVTGFADETQVGDVPVYIVSVDISNAQATSFETVAEWAFGHAYNWLLGQRSMTADVNDYAQMRLLRGSGGLRTAWDIVSEMLPANDVVYDFLAAYYIMLQSPKYSGDSRSAELAALNLGEDTYRFRITFVLHTNENASVTANNVSQVIRFGTDNAATGANTRVRFNASRERMRFLSRSQDGYIGRASTLNVSTRDINPAALSRFQRSRKHAEKQIRRGNAPTALPDILAGVVPAIVPIVPAAPGVKRAYKKRRTADEIAAAVLGLPLGQSEKRVRKEWTDEQRARYNEKRRKGGGNIHGLTYDKLKSRLFHHTSLDEFYHFSKAVLLVPNTWDQGYCLAMALLKSECRTYSGDGSSVEESKPFAKEAEEGQMYARIPILAPYEDLVDEDCDFVEGAELVLFNPYKYPSTETESGLKYCVTPSDTIVQKWYAAAKNLHLFVENEVGMELDENSEATLQAYADVFGIHVSVYNLEIMGKRTSVIKPVNVSVDVRKEESFRVVSLLVSDHHCSAITNLRTFLRNSVSGNRSAVHNYCVFCEKLNTSNNETKAEAQAHFVSCSHKKDGRICCESDKVNRKKIISDIHPDQYWFNSRKKCWICKLCSEEMVGGTSQGQIHHTCWIKKPTELKQGEASGIFVYDFECCQVKQPDMQTFVHRVNLVCVKRVYADESGDFDEHCFATLEEFIAYVLSYNTEKRVYLAHNGAKYDVQFVVNYFEKNLIAHHFVPSPGSMHAYLSVTVEFGAKAKATFLDFRHFMPGSLKNIAVSFGLSQQKGDFPHHFNNGFNDNYVGALPALYDPADFWCLESKRSQEEVDDFVAWYASQGLLYCTCSEECTCTKQKWSFQTEIIRYCRLDVDVLAEACARYRDWAMAFCETIEGWTACPIDPFEYLTIPQVAMGVLLAGLPEEENIAITPWKDRRDRVPNAIAWMERIIATTGKNIHHAANWGREYMCPKTRRYLDGVTDDMHVYICLDCQFHACPLCYQEEIETGVDHPNRPATYGRVNHDTKDFVTDLLCTYGTDRTTVIWAHDCGELSEYEKELGKIIKDREMFKGGRTEVFSPYFNVDHYPDDEIKYHDVCSLYPFVCAFAELPIGNPEHFCGVNIDMSRFYSEEEDRYMGYLRCKVKPCVYDKLGLLPCHDVETGRLEFPLHVMTGTWGTEELRLACENGYEILETYEVLHWPSSERSNTVMRGYVSFFLRMKQEAEGWKKLGASCDTPTEEEQLAVTERLFASNGGIARIRPELVRKDPVNRQLAKLYLNSLWGKFCQKPHTDNYSTIHGYAEFIAIWNDPNVNRKKVSFRYISSGTWKVKYHLQSDFAKANPKYNIYLSSKVTEVARCQLHRQMLQIGSERILYCDTDSIIFYWPKAAEPLDKFGLGQWVDELPGVVIKKLHALAPKFYHLELEDEETMLKSKGIQMTWANRQKITSKTLGRQLLELYYPRTDAEGAKLPFQGYMHMSNMLMGVRNCVSYDLPFLTPHTLGELGKPEVRVRHDVDSPYVAEKTGPGDFQKTVGVLYTGSQCGVRRRHRIRGIRPNRYNPKRVLFKYRRNK